MNLTNKSFSMYSVKNFLEILSTVIPQSVLLSDILLIEIFWAKKKCIVKRKAAVFFGKTN